MTNIIGYLQKYGDCSLSDKPFNEVDSLVLCQLSYLNFNGFVKGLDKDSSPVRVKDILASEDKEHLLDDYWYKEDNMKLFTAFANSERFGETKLNFYSHVMREEDDVQFAAITFLLPDKSVYIAYRGTDATLVGWKEDIKLAYSEPVYAQVLAANYMDYVADYIAGYFRAGGHSKGGNLAVYSLMFCKNITRSQVIEVFDHDGPGFRPEVLKEGHYAAIKNKVHKYIPKESIVGIIMEDSDDFDVIDSYSVGAFQHNSYSWKCDEDSFIREKDFSDYKKHKNSAMNEWIYSLSDKEIDLFTDALYETFSEVDSKNLFDIAKDPKKNLVALHTTYKEMDEKTKDVLILMLRRLLNIAELRTKEQMQSLKEEGVTFVQSLFKKNSD